jgi:flagellar hook protein FlgE
MYTSISGLKNHQALLDTVANNIANVNTYGFKSSRVAFKDMLNQTIQGASSPNSVLGGTNNRQVGLGMQIDSITQVHTQGNIQTTGAITDLAISGDGFFRVTNDGSNLATAPLFYQRAGNLNFDANGNLVTSDGYYVLGWDEDAGNLGNPDLAAPTLINAPPATTRSVSIDQEGKVTLIDNAGVISIAGWISMAKFPNSPGLTQAGNNKWQESNNSGSPVEGTAGDANGIGVLVPGALEMSNVDLASEFTEMIRAQRGFQANSRVITTSDEILQELVNLKR